jgi:hypothetical protein
MTLTNPDHYSNWRYTSLLQYLIGALNSAHSKENSRSFFLKSSPPAHQCNSIPLVTQCPWESTLISNNQTIRKSCRIHLQNTCRVWPRLSTCPVITQAESWSFFLDSWHSQSVHLIPTSGPPPTIHYNTVARGVLCTWKSDHVIVLFRCLMWLPPHLE